MDLRTNDNKVLDKPTEQRAGGDGPNPSPPKSIVGQVAEVARVAADMVKLEEAVSSGLSTQKKIKDAEWETFTSYNWKEVPPPVLANMYSKLPLGPSGSYLTVAQCLALALEYFETGKNPLKGHCYILPSGRIGTSLEGLLIELKNKGVAIGKPKYEKVKRPWPKGLIMSRKERGRDLEFQLDEEPGMRIVVKIDDEEVEYTCWLTEWFMGANPNWYTRMDWMLRVRAFMNCLKLGSGVGISEEIADEGGTQKEAPAPPEAKAPSRFPTGR